MIDVIMPTYNRASSLEKVIGSYLEQEFLGLFIIVDDCSTDRTEELCLGLIKKYPDKIIYKKLDKKTTTPDLRNIGIGLSKNSYIFMGEDDVILSKDHFKILLEKMNKFGADIISGRRVYIHENESFERAIEIADKDREPIFITYPFEGYFERYLDRATKVPYVHANSLIKRDVFNKVLYDKGYTGNAFREELDFYLRAHDAGFSIYLIPDTICFHFKNTKVNKRGGARKKRFIYEFQVWRNSFRCFWKNRNIFKKEFGIQNIYLFCVVFIASRYYYAFKRRINWYKKNVKA